MQDELQEISRTADEYREKCKLSSRQNEDLASEADGLSKEIKRLELNLDVRNNDYEQLKVNQTEIKLMNKFENAVECRKNCRWLPERPMNIESSASL